MGQTELDISLKCVRDRKTETERHIDRVKEKVRDGKSVSKSKAESEIERRWLISPF